MSAASDRANAALAALEETAKAVISTRGQAAAAYNDYAIQCSEVEAAITALRMEKADISATVTENPSTTGNPAP